MRILALGLAILLSCTGCSLMPQTHYEKQTVKLHEDIELLKLEVRREKLMNELEDLEGTHEE